MISNEQAVIAGILIDSRVLRAVLVECSPADFADPRLEHLLERLVEMAAAGDAIDVLTVGPRLAEWRIGFPEADLHSWISDVLFVSRVPEYAALVAEAAVRRRAETAARSLLDGLESRETGPLVQEAIQALSEVGGGRTADRDVKTLRQVLSQPTEYDWVVENLLERGDRLMLTGSEGGGKSTLVRQIAVMSAAGIHPFTFRAMRPARVLVVDAENTELQWARKAGPLAAKAAQRGTVDPLDVMRLECTGPMDITRPSDLGQVHRWIDLYRPDVLCIGPIYMLVPGALNNDDDAAPVLQALRSMRDRGVALIVEAHAGHTLSGGRERDLRPRGSAALLGWPEFGMGLAPDREGKSSADFRLIRWRGDRDERGWPTRISRGGADGWPWTPNASWRFGQERL